MFIERLPFFISQIKRYPTLPKVAERFIVCSIVGVFSLILFDYTVVYDYKCHICTHTLRHEKPICRLYKFKLKFC